MQGLSWFKSQKSTEYVSVGSKFRHKIPGNSSEIATVLGIEEDHMGIPHVIYSLRVEMVSRESYQDRRTLALESFRDRFGEAISA